VNALTPYDLNLPLPVHNLLTAQRTCDCGRPLPSFAASYQPLRQPSTPDEHAACRARKEAERIEQVKAAAESAATEWERLRARHAFTPTILAVLDLHHPEPGYRRINCGHCEQHDGMEDTEQVPWPCATFTAICNTVA
jgi:hypothetical protein